jgi:diguanylate cyclase (GGDEF)-like protein/PAS domain S-box-containing protein
MEELLQFLYLMPVGVVKFRATGKIDLINPMASALLLPLTPDASLDDLYTSLASLVPDLRRRVEHFTGQAGVIIDQRQLDVQTGGQARVLSLTVNRINDTVYMAVLKDVTRLHEQQKKLFADRQRFRAIFDHIRDYAIYTIALDGTVEEWNQSLHRYAGWHAADVEGQSIRMFFPSGEPGQPPAETLLVEAERVGSVETEGPQRKRDGSVLWADTVITALPDESGRVRGFVVVSRDMTERKRLEDDLKRLATVDPLTGADNRRRGQERLAVEFNRYACDEQQPVSVLMLDIDHFKSINDQHGHPAGDAVLRALVQTCKASLRAVDTVARWGGEEFLLILPGTRAAAAVSVAERLRTEIAAMRVAVPGGATISLTASIGVAESAGGDPNELLRRADKALYAAKARGRNRVEWLA